MLDLAFATAEAQNVSLVVANDPDADRFAAAERDSETGKLHLHSLCLIQLLRHRDGHFVQCKTGNDLCADCFAAAERDSEVGKLLLHASSAAQKQPVLTV